MQLHLQKKCYIFLGTLLCWLLFTKSTDACGCTTHNEIARRATYWFNSNEYPEYAALITKYPQAFQNGACFPDWGYVVGARNAAEAAHWPPLMKEEANWIRTHYPQPWSEEGEKWVAFLLGQMSHSTADLTWHDMEIVYSMSHQGFIQSLGYSEYWGSFDIAHAIADNGGEAVVAFTMNTSFLHDVWYFPLMDLYELYRQQGFTEVTVNGLLEGNIFLFAEAWATHFEGAELFPLAAIDSCFLQEQFLSFFLGGVDDMAWWSQKCWHSIIKWIETADYDDICYIQSEDSLQQFLSENCVNRTNEYQWQSDPDRNHSKLNFCRRHYQSRMNKAWKARLLPYVRHVSVEPHGRGVLLKMDITALRSRRGTPLSPPPKNSRFLERVDNSTNSTCHRTTDSTFASNLLNFTLTKESKYAYFGSSLTSGDYDGDGIDDLAVGAPGYTFDMTPQRGLVQIYFGRKNATKFSSHQILGQYEYSRFGYALATVDLNRDGIDDLVVSAPTVLSERLLYKGLVFVYLGRKHFSPTIPDFVINVGYYDKYNLTTSGSFTNLGHTLYAFDVDGDRYNDLIIGSPFACDIDFTCNLSYGWANYQRGLVAVFLSSTFSKFTSRIERPTILSLNESDWLQFGSQIYQWFGFHVNFYRTLEGRRILLVAAPGATDWDVTQSLVGRLLAYDVTDITTGKVKLYWTIVGRQRFDKFGWWTTIGNPYSNTVTKDNSSHFIAISVATTSVDQDIFHWFQSGKIFLFSLNSLSHGGNYSSSMLEQAAVIFENNVDFARFGWRTALVDVNGDKIDDFLVASPYRTSKRDSTVGESGAFFVFLGGKNFPK
jgi:glycosylphosphatidylinositol phospholipase D